MNSAYALRREICEVGRRVYQRGYVAANDGNISVRMQDDRILCTPTGVSKGFITGNGVELKRSLAGTCRFGFK